MFPCIEINLNNILENFKIVQSICRKNDIHLAVVTKIFADNIDIVSNLVNNGVEIICDSRIENLISYNNLNVQKWLIREPMISEISEVVKYSDVSLNTEITTILALNEEAKKQNKIHKIILMYELGDLREGCFESELESIIEQSLYLTNIEILGIGTNLSCYGEIIPTTENMDEFISVVNKLEHKFNLKFEIISGGNSSSYKMLSEGKLPKKINNLRLGESIFFGRVPCFEEEINYLNHNNFILKAQIIELKEKPSVPWGEFGKTNSFGETTEFEAKGIQKRAIIGIGKQDVRIEGITPLDSEIEILGGSSDHIILDLTNCSKYYKVGDIIEFKPTYASCLSAMTSKYVKRIIKEI